MYYQEFGFTKPYISFSSQCDIKGIYCVFYQSYRLMNSMDPYWKVVKNMQFKITIKYGLTLEKDHYQKDSICWTECREKGNFALGCRCVGRMLSKKLNEFSYDPACQLLSMSWKKTKSVWKREIQNHCSSIYNNQETEINYVSVSG